MAEDDDESPKAGDAKEDKAARMNSAKAFYRAMYAGAEPDPEEFGIDLGGSKQQGGGGDDGASQSTILHLEVQLKEVEAKALEWENLYKRIVADFDNFKKRMDRERDEMQAIGMQKALEAILPGLDDLDMAQTKLTETTEAKVMLQSIKMILTRFNRCLEQVGIKQMQVIGEPFDPRFHEPIQEVHTAEFPEGAVVQQLRPGYLFGEKVLRPTLVNVATAPLDGPGYQPPVPGSEVKAAQADNKVEVTEAEVVAASPPTETKSEAPEAVIAEAQPEPAAETQTEAQPKSAAESQPESASESQPESASESQPESASGSRPESISESQSEAQAEAKVESASTAPPEPVPSDKGPSETSDELTPVDKNASLAEQFSVQDIPSDEFETSLEAEAAAAASEMSSKKTEEEAVASSEEG